jgi:FlaA1/EpsC-like NDP-sugar epimerase
MKTARSLRLQVISMAAIPRWCFTVAKTGIDLALLAGAFVVAFAARFEGSIPPDLAMVLWCSLPVVLAVQYTALALFKVHRLAWRSVSRAEVHCILLALAVGTAGLVGIRLAAGFWPLLRPYFLIPYGVILVDFVLCVLGLLGTRGFWRVRMDSRERARLILNSCRRATGLLIGTDHVMIQMARELASRPQAALDLVGIVSEDPAQLNMIMGGLPVLGGLRDLKQLVERHAVEQVLIPHSDDGEVVRALLRQCDRCGVKARLLDVRPADDDKATLSRLRQITVEVLLRRPPVRLGGDTVAGMLQGRTVFVTGAGGSIGSQLCREICRFRPQRLVLVERAENSLFQVHRQLSHEFRQAPLVPAIADITDASRMEQLFRAYRPEVVLHAAHKHLPMMEWNVREAIKNNVEGTCRLADWAHRNGCARFVMVSTDKAVRPTSVMGVSKRVAELYVQALAQQSPTCFVTVRFGNVLGSAGSVIPIFQEQIANGGPVTVTHPDMKRYFMTIPEACQLPLEAGSLGQGGEIFILDMGEPVKIVDLAHDMIHLSGLRPEIDIEVRFTGIRPGEKLFEEISLEEENAERTRHPRIWIGRKPARDFRVLSQQIAELIKLGDCGDAERMREKFKEIVPDFETEPAGKPPSSNGTAPPGRVPADAGVVSRASAPTLS